jgi:Uma2 family endonuclease
LRFAFRVSRFGFLVDSHWDPDQVARAAAFPLSFAENYALGEDRAEIKQKVTTPPMFTSADLASMPHDGKLYEVIEGELYVSRQPSFYHQFTCGRLFRLLDEWNEQTGLGVVNAAPGLIFAEDDDVAPDLVWMSWDRFNSAIGEDGRLHSAPELVVEVLSPGPANATRDRETKLKLYSRRGVHEYWIVSWQERRVEVKRRDADWLTLWRPVESSDSLESPLLPGFAPEVNRFFFRPPTKVS